LCITAKRRGKPGIGLRLDPYPAEPVEVEPEAEPEEIAKLDKIAANPASKRSS
jgi:hypothetical protein